jgi:hypothetical protein
MMNVKRGRGLHRGVLLCAIAALGFALSGCGGKAAGSSAASSAAATSAPAQSTTPSQAATSGQASTPPQAATPPQTSATPPATSAGGGTPAGSSSSGSSSSNPPTASIGSVTLNWLPPTENVDGTPLTNLAGYNIHYGTASGNYTQTIAVSNPGIATYVVSDLTPGTYYFSVAAVNSQGTESPLSAEVSTTVN